MEGGLAKKGDRMDYKLKIGERTVDVAAERAEGHWVLTIDDRSMAVSASFGEEGRVRLRVDGQARPLWIVRTDDGTWVWDAGRVRFVQDAEGLSRRRGSDLDHGPTEVTPATPSQVIAVHVKVGDHAQKGQACVVVTAMKMETTLGAPYAGTVTAVNTREGAKANPGDILVEIEKDPEEEESAT
jgi:biotin carboxyl carrier protein